MTNLDLLPYNRYAKPRWDLRGGTVEEGKASWVIPAHESKEELGLVRRLGPLLLIDHVALDGDDSVLERAALMSVRFCTIENLGKMFQPSLASRLVTAVTTATTDAPALCELGKCGA